MNRFAALDSELDPIELALCDCSLAELLRRVGQADRATVPPPGRDKP